MTSPLLNILMQYAGSVATGVLVGLIFKVYFANQVRKKIRGYQAEIIKSHSKILKLEETNDKLEKWVRDCESNFEKDQLIMN